MYGKEDRKVRIAGQPRPLTPLMEDLLTKVQGEAGEMLQHFPLIIAKERVSPLLSSSSGLLLAAGIPSSH